MSDKELNRLVDKPVWKPLPAGIEATADRRIAHEPKLPMVRVVRGSSPALACSAR
jgi:hypothetical protein